MDRRTFLISAAALGSTFVALPAFAGAGRKGTFSGAARYGISGTAEVTGNQVRLLDDFRFGNAPDPKVALGKDGYDPNTLMGLLKNKEGASSYTVPAGIDTADYNEVWIWCERFNVPLGVAKLA
jgi:hypothetical protein